MFNLANMPNLKNKSLNVAIVRALSTIYILDILFIQFLKKENSNTS